MLQVLAAESQSTDRLPSNASEAPPPVIISETDMDSQPSVSVAERSEVTSPPPFREGSEMPHVSQSQEVI